jgi:hypothetical protein
MGKIMEKDFYNRYCEYCKKSHEAIIAVTLSEESRKKLEKEIPYLSEIEFEESLNLMTDDVRESFIRMINAGYEATRSSVESDFKRSLQWVKDREMIEIQITRLNCGDWFASTPLLPDPVVSTISKEHCIQLLLQKLNVTVEQLDIKDVSKMDF